MKKLLFVIMLTLSSPVYADTYTWKDDIGVHFTDNPGTIPLKYRDQAMAEMRADEGKSNPVVIESSDSNTYDSGQTASPRTRGPKKAKQFRRGKLISQSEIAANPSRDGCLLYYAFEPGQNVAWTPNSSSSGTMKMEVQTESDCLQDCIDNAQNKALDAPKRWKLIGSCTYYGKDIWRK